LSLSFQALILIVSQSLALVANHTRKELAFKWNTPCPEKNIPDIFDCNLKRIIRF